MRAARLLADERVEGIVTPGFAGGCPTVFARIRRGESYGTMVLQP